MPARKKSSRIKWGNIGLLCAIALIVGVASFLFFAPREEPRIAEPTLPPEADYILVDLHFPTTDEDWGREARQIEIDDEAVMLRAVIEGLVEGPRRMDLLPSVPASIAILRIEFAWETQRVDISLSNDFNAISPSERITLVGSMVYTLTELEFVTNLRFFVGTTPVFDEADALRNRGNTLLQVDAPVPTPIIVTLFFPDEQMPGLVAEERAVPFDTHADGEYAFITEALIQGPVTAGLSPAMSPNVTFNSVRRLENTIFVDFTPDFVTHFTGGSSAEHMMIFSLVNTLTNIRGVTRVQIWVDGHPISEDSPFHMDLSSPIERDESLILERDN